MRFLAVVLCAFLAAAGLGTLNAGALMAYTLTLGSCAHLSGQTILAVDSLGDEVQVGT